MLDLKYGNPWGRTSDNRWQIRFGTHLDQKNHPHQTQWFIVPTTGEENVENTWRFDTHEQAVAHLLTQLNYEAENLQTAETVTLVVRKTHFHGWFDKGRLKLVMDDAIECQELGRSKPLIEIGGARYKVLGCAGDGFESYLSLEEDSNEFGARPESEVGDD